MLPRHEEDGQETCLDPVVVVGGGFLTMELAGTIAKYRDDKVPVTVVLSRDRMLPGLFGAPTKDENERAAGDGAEHDVGKPKEADGVPGARDVAEFYERQLVKIGVRFVREHRCLRLWAADEEGDFPTMEGPAISLQRTRPRHFGPAQPQFRGSRGVVVEARHGGDLAWLPARFVVLALGSIPNSEVFAKSLDLSGDGAILVDATCRASHASGDVYAIGDVATAPLPLSRENEVRLPFESSAKAMATFVAETIWDGHLKHALGGHAPPAEGNVSAKIYDPVPLIRSRFLDLDWEFHGRNLGDVVPLGLESYASTKVFGAFWVLDNRVVGCFLEGGTPSQRAALPEIARLQPQITRVQKFRKLSLDQFLDDPRCLEPPELAPGEFQAELDVECIVEAFQRYDFSGDGFAKTASIGELMRDLGADWDAEEEAEALRALDPYGNNMVSLDAFTHWWAN